MTKTTSTAPAGEQFPLHTPQDEAAELQRLQALTADHRAQGHEIVVVLGVWSYQTLMGFEDDIFKITPLTPTLLEEKPGRLPIFSQGK